MGYITVRNVSGELEKALRNETRRRGKSLNQTVIDLLKQALGIGLETPNTNGLETLAGTWTQEEFECFERATAVFEQIDEEEWR